MDNTPFMSAEEARRIAEEKQREIGLNLFETIIKDEISKSAHSGQTNCAVTVHDCYADLIEQTISSQLEQAGYKVIVDRGTAPSAGMRWFKIKW